MQRLRGWNKLATMPKKTRVAESLGGPGGMDELVQILQHLCRWPGVLFC